MERSKLLIGIGVAVLVITGLFIAVNSRDGGYRDNGIGNNQSENTYVSDDYGFSFEVPEGYEVLEVEDSEHNRHSIVMSRTEDNVVPENGEGPPAITIDIFESVSEDTVESWIQGNNISNFGIMTGSLEEIKVDGTSAVRYSWDGLYRGRSVAFMTDNNVILVSGTYLEESDPIYSDFDKVVSSIEVEG